MPPKSSHWKGDIKLVNVRSSFKTWVLCADGTQGLHKSGVTAQADAAETKPSVSLNRYFSLVKGIYSEKQWSISDNWVNVAEV